MQTRPALDSLLGAALLALTAIGCSAKDPPATAHPAAAAVATHPDHCLPDGGGFLRARLRGALNVDLDWRDPQMHCEGGPRPDGAGLRVSMTGPLPKEAGPYSGRTLRFVFGIDAAAVETEGSALATNITAIIEGGSQGDATLFATRGDDKCTTDKLQRRATSNTEGGAVIVKSVDGTKQREFRVDVRGFCLGPASTLDGAERVLVTTFDFAGRVTLDSP